MAYQSPGVYIEEIPSGPQPIAAASTSVVAVVGSTRKGPFMRPTRVAGWADFTRTFGEAHAGGFTAEAVYGFFENGGPAAWVVRVDPSRSSTWLVSDAGSADSFVISATSGGSWARALLPMVAPDTSGAEGRLFSTTITGAVAVPNGAADIPVRSVVGLAPGTSVTLANAAGETASATVVSLSADSIRVSSTSSITLAEGDRIAGALTASDTSVRLSAGSGFVAGDILVAVAADGSRSYGRISSVSKEGATTLLGLSTPVGNVNGVQLTRRRHLFRGTIPAGGATFSLNNVAIDGAAKLKPADIDGQLTKARIVTSTGQVAHLTSGSTFKMEGGADSPSGAVTLEAQLHLVLHRKLIDVNAATNDEAVDALVKQLGYLPTGTQVLLSDDEAATTSQIERTATGFTPTTGLKSTHWVTAQCNVVDGAAPSVLVVDCPAAPTVGEFVELSDDPIPITQVEQLGGSTYSLALDAPAEATVSAPTSDDHVGLLAFTTTRLLPLRFSLRVREDDAVAEEYTGLSLDPTHPVYYARDGVINGTSPRITVAPRAGTAPLVSANTVPVNVTPDKIGSDEAPETSHYKDGLAALDTAPEPAMLICPDLVTFDDELLQADLAGALVSYAEASRRFAIVDAPNIADDQALLAWRNTAVSSTYAAVFAPHLTIVTINPGSTDRFTTVPPSGFVAGVMARTDRERGVHKAPGNERVTGIVGLTQDYTQRRQDFLNPGAVNLIRAFPGRGIRVWGARNATDDGTWRYINVRRLFNFVETSVENATQWVVFEPNTASTWIRIKVSLENFLDQLWRAGALAGTTPEQAYRVRVGLGETMQESDIDLGLVITEVSIAPAKPAEFVVFRFSHKRLSE